MPRRNVGGDCYINNNNNIYVCKQYKILLRVWGWLSICSAGAHPPPPRPHIAHSMLCGISRAKTTIVSCFLGAARLKHSCPPNLRQQRRRWSAVFLLS